MRQQCNGIYSKKDWGGPHDVFIDVGFTSENKEGWIAVVIFEYRNVNDLGKPIEAAGGERVRVFVL
jgi:hypothetical protein